MLRLGTRHPLSLNYDIMSVRPVLSQEPLCEHSKLDPTLHETDFKGTNSDLMSQLNFKLT